MGRMRDKVARGVFWVLLEKFGVQAVHFVVTLVLARILSPDDYGTVALLSIFIAVANVLVDCGFGKALVQKKNASRTDYNTVFYLSMAFAALLYGGLFLLAPFVADFYGIPGLKIMLRVLSLTLFFHSINGVQNVELNRKMLFHLSFRISWVRIVVASATGIFLAAAGYGPWALVWSSLAGGIAGVVARQLVIRWRPSFTFSWESARGLLRFGWKFAVASLIVELMQNLYALLIGKFYTRADLAFVKKGEHPPRLLMKTADASLARVSFPALVRMQDDPLRLRGAMRRMIVCSSFVVFPLMVGCAVLAEPLILLLFGDRWLPAVPYFRITCLACVLRPFNTINIQAINARGRSDVYLVLVIVRRALALLTMAFTIRMGVLPFVFASALVVGPVAVVVNAVPSQKYLGYTLLMQCRDVLPAAMLSLSMGAVMLAAMALPAGPLLLLFPVTGLGALFYCMGAIVFRMRPVAEFAAALRPIVVKRAPRVSAILSRLVRRCA